MFAYVHMALMVPWKLPGTLREDKIGGFKKLEVDGIIALAGDRL